MNDINAVRPGRIEDKWREFVATEFAGRRDAARCGAQALRRRASDRMRLVEVHASYVWLLAGAVLAWIIR